MVGGICSMPHFILHWYHRYFFVLKNVFIAVSSAQLVGEGMLAGSQGFAVQSVCWDDAHRQMGNEGGWWSCAKGCAQMSNDRIPERSVLEGTLKLT